MDIFRKLLYILTGLTFLILFITLFTLGFWVFYPYKILNFDSPKILVNEKFIKPGGILSVHSGGVTVYINGIRTLTLTRIQDGSVINLPDINSVTRRGHSDYTTYIRVPDYLTPNHDYVISRTIIFYVNPLRTITIFRQSESFQVKSN